MRRFALPLLLWTWTLTLAACARSPASTDQTTPQPFDSAQDKPASVSSTESVSSASNDASESTDLTRTDQQGATTVVVTPLNLGNSTDQLEFDVSLDTHSVDLSMDLATLSTLTTDTGITVQAASWDAPRGGHHVAGKLIFPAVKDGKSVLEGAGKLTLTITNVDAPSRVFEWQLK